MSTDMPSGFPVLRMMPMTSPMKPLPVPGLVGKRSVRRRSKLTSLPLPAICTWEEIARALQLPLATVKVKIHRARLNLAALEIGETEWTKIFPAYNSWLTAPLSCRWSQRGNPRPSRYLSENPPSIGETRRTGEASTLFAGRSCTTQKGEWNGSFKESTEVNGSTQCFSGIGGRPEPHDGYCLHLFVGWTARDSSALCLWRAGNPVLGRILCSESKDQRIKKDERSWSLVLFYGSLN